MKPDDTPYMDFAVAALLTVLAGLTALAGSVVMERYRMRRADRAAMIASKADRKVAYDRFLDAVWGMATAMDFSHRLAPFTSGLSGIWWHGALVRSLERSAQSNAALTSSLQSLYLVASPQVRPVADQVADAVRGLADLHGRARVGHQYDGAMSIFGDAAQQFVTTAKADLESPPPPGLVSSKWRSAKAWAATRLPVLR